MADPPAGMPRAEPAPLGPDPASWLDLEGLCEGLTHFKAPSSRCPTAGCILPAAAAEQLPLQPGGLGRSSSHRHLKEPGHRGDDCTVPLEAMRLPCGTLLLKVLH